MFKILLSKIGRGAINAIPFVASIKNDVKEGKNIISLERLIEIVSILILAISMKYFDISFEYVEKLLNLIR